MTVLPKTVGNYKLMRLIGEGATAEVYEGHKIGDPQKFAIKMIKIGSLNEEQRAILMKEGSILKEIDHPYIVKYIDSMTTSKNHYFVFEFCEKGNLEKYLKNYFGALIPQEIAQQILFKIATAVSVIHGKNIVHRDIKLANILLK